VVDAAERLDRKAAYVAYSTGRQFCDVFAVDKERLFGVCPCGNRRAALDPLKEQRRSSCTALARTESVVKGLKSLQQSPEGLQTRIRHQSLNVLPHIRIIHRYSSARTSKNQKRYETRWIPGYELFWPEHDPMNHWAEEIAEYISNPTPNQALQQSLAD
jgi:hypothetical protein